LDAAVAAVL